ncbi:V-type ATP synthase subunit D [Parathalassolituus penaei]|uniref:V-type ATP synthase subunit D n=1 Tax=Parathalassolituus penaei TaxID=2997323 RepID=A0A9X3EFY6_9GAMM|nr:V-type ATP synthase subunit D [Parathalassolituus penaei]MCY0966857.1 V-type ATP synthase subunit D [Parathalassolituus penaei]
MARLLLSKSSLLQQRQQLATYQRFLPSLELKRQQLMQSVKETEQAQAECLQRLTMLENRVAEQLPMLAIQEIDLQGLVSLKSFERLRRNLAGVWVEELETVRFERAAIPLLARPHWVPVLQQWLEEAIRMQLQVEILASNLLLIHEALRKVTQRMNLFDKVLIPQTREHIRTIRIYLDDKAREAVVTSKIAKARQREQESGL